MESYWAVSTAGRGTMPGPSIEASVPQGKSGVRWTRPDVLVEVSYPNKSGDGRLRLPAFKGFRDDLGS